MKSLLTSAAAVALFSGAAYAADLPVPEAPIVAPAPIYDWSGFYVGAQAGWIWGDADADFDNGAPSLQLDPDGWALGGFIGYNAQFNWFVVGVEGDIEWTDVDGSDSSAVFPTSQSDIDLNWDASIRARAGVAFNRFLVYATGGAAYVDVDIDGGPLGGPFGSLDENDNEWGWTVGGGAEWAITNNIIIGAEYRFTDYGDISGDLAPPFPAVTESVDLSTHAVRGRVSFKFNGLGP